jgi:hypothetical protein
MPHLFEPIWINKFILINLIFEFKFELENLVQVLESNFKSRLEDHFQGLHLSLSPTLDSSVKHNFIPQIT